MNGCGVIGRVCLCSRRPGDSKARIEGCAEAAFTEGLERCLRCPAGAVSLALAALEHLHTEGGPTVIVSHPSSCPGSPIMADQGCLACHNPTADSDNSIVSLAAP